MSIATKKAAGPTIMKPNVNNIFYHDVQAPLDTSTTKSDYKPWAVDRRSPIKADHNLKTRMGSNMSANLGPSTYLNDYKKYEQSSPVSHAKADYTKKTVLRSPTNAQFDGSTRYKDTFIQHQLPEKYVRPKDQYIKNANSLDSLTTNQRDFTQKSLEARKPFKPGDNDLFNLTPKPDDALVVTPRRFGPPNTWTPPTDPMQTTTNYSKDYEHKTIERTQKIRPISRKRTTGKFVGDTTYAKEFPRYTDHEQASPIRKAGELQMPNNHPFEVMTTYRGNYQHPTVLSEQRRPFKPTGELLFSEAPFNANTSYQSEFTAKDGDRAQFDRARSNNIFDMQHKKPTTKT